MSESVWADGELQSVRWCVFVCTECLTIPQKVHTCNKLHKFTHPALPDAYNLESSKKWMYSNHYKVPAVVLHSVNKSVSMVTVISALPVWWKFLWKGRHNRTMNVKVVCISSHLITIFLDVQEAKLHLLS